MADKDKNRNIDGPIFDINQGSIDFSIYKMDTGFLVLDNATKAKHSISKLEDLEAVFEVMHDGIKEKIRNLMNNKNTFDYIDVGVQITEGFDNGDQFNYEDVIPESMELNYDQLADIVNEIISSSPTAGLAGRAGHRNPVYISKEQIFSAMNSSRNAIKLRKRVGDNVKQPIRDKGVRSDPSSGENRDIGKPKKIIFGNKENRDIDKEKEDSASRTTDIS